MLGDKYLLLEIDKSEAEFYHLPNFVPYVKDSQEELNESGFDWEIAVRAMRKLISEMDIDEYKPYKLFIRKWDHYKTLSHEIREENWNQAEKIIDKILSIDLLDPSAYLNLGFVFRNKGEFNKAEQAYLKGLELVGESIPFLAGLARTYEELGKIDDAIYAWKQIWDMDPDPENGNEEAIKMLVKHMVYREEEYRDAKFKRKAKRYIPGDNFERLMRKEFQKNYNSIESLTSLGLQLIEAKYGKLAVKVFERVYQLSQLETQKQELQGV